MKKISAYTQFYFLILIFKVSVWIILNYDDAQLVSNYIGGCEKSLEVLINKHKYKLYNFIYSKVLNKDNAEDLFQEPLLK